MKTSSGDFTNKGGSGNPRPLRVGEAIRHAIAQVLMRGECHAVGLTGASITVSEVRVGPDMKNASVYVMPLGGAQKEGLLKVLIEAAPEIRYLVSKRVNLRYMPKLYFMLDESFDEAERINKLLKKPEVQRDLSKSDDGK